jgi:hypothetical protein
MAGGRKVVFLGPGTLRLTEGGREYRPGDEVTMSDVQRASLAAPGVGMRFGAVPDEPPPPAPAPEPPALEPAEVSKVVRADKAPAPAKEGK